MAWKWCEESDTVGSLQVTCKGTLSLTQITNNRERMGSKLISSWEQQIHNSGTKFGIAEVNLSKLNVKKNNAVPFTLHTRFCTYLIIGHHNFQWWPYQWKVSRPNLLQPSLLTTRVFQFPRECLSDRKTWFPINKKVKLILYCNRI